MEEGKIMKFKTDVENNRTADADDSAIAVDLKQTDESKQRKERLRKSAPKKLQKESELCEIIESLDKLINSIGSAEFVITDFGIAFGNRIKENLYYAKEILKERKEGIEKELGDCWTSKKYDKCINFIKQKIDELYKVDLHDLAAETELFPISKDILYYAFVMRYLFDKADGLFSNG